MMFMSRYHLRACKTAHTRTLQYHLHTYTQAVHHNKTRDCARQLGENLILQLSMGRVTGHTAFLISDIIYKLNVGRSCVPILRLLKDYDFLTTLLSID